VSGEATSLGEAGTQAPTWVYDHTAPRVLATPPWLAYVKISEGCDYTCSFCIIPRRRGRHRSRNVEDVVAEVRSLAARSDVHTRHQDVSFHRRRRVVVYPRPRRRGRRVRRGRYPQHYRYYYRSLHISPLFIPAPAGRGSVGFIPYLL
jgi:radical SAM superfamily enzyme YgiQ (UPF0313 family)